MATIQLSVEPRDNTGKGVARKLRAVHRLPAVLYGRTDRPISLSIDEADFKTAITTQAGLRVVLNLDFARPVEGAADAKVAIVKDIQRHPVSRQVLHADLMAISLKDPIRVRVPLNQVGVPVGVRLDDGALTWQHRDVEIEVLPTEIPDSIDVDVSELNVGQTLHVSDLAGGAFQMVEDAETALCTVVSTAIKVTEEEEAAEGEEGAEETTAEGEEKPAEEPKEG